MSVAVVERRVVGGWIVAVAAVVVVGVPPLVTKIDPKVQVSCLPLE